MLYKLSLFLLLNFKIILHQQFLRASDVSIVDFSVDDIFGNFVPVQIVTDQLNHIFSKNYTDKETFSLKSKSWMCSNSSDLSTAVNAMRYHRQMMNQYLISGYLLKEITGSIKNTANITKPSIEKRFGKSKNNTYTDNSAISSVTNLIPTNHKLIDDEGSSQYTSWLKRKLEIQTSKKAIVDLDTLQNIVIFIDSYVNFQTDPRKT